MLEPDEIKMLLRGAMKDEGDLEKESFRAPQRGFFEFDPAWLAFVYKGPEVREALMDQPDEFLAALAEAAESVGDYTKEGHGKMPVILKVHPDRGMNDNRIQEIRFEKDAGKLLYIEGTVKSKTPAFLQLIKVTWKCKDCGTLKDQPIYEDTELPGSRKCSCGGKMFKNKEEMQSLFYVTLEEPYTLSKNNELTQIPVTFRGILAGPVFEEKITRGSPIKIAAILKPRKGKEPNQLKYWLEAKGVAFLQEEGQNVVVTDAGMEKLKEIKSKMSLVDYWSENLFTQVQGERKVKESLIVQMVGNEAVRKGGKLTRGDVHILMCGDPGSSKSTLLKLVQMYGLKTRYAAGKGASGVGITAAVRKDEFLGTWVVEAGAFPLAHHGICLLDEVDKLDMTETDRLHEAMEQQELHIDRANVHVTLPCQTSLLAAGNPKEGTFDPNGDLYSQLGFAPTFINRFDLIWILLDSVDSVRDTKIAKTILKNLNTDHKTDEDVMLFKQYLVLAKKVKTHSSKELEEKLTEWYQKMRGQVNKSRTKSRINARTLESLSRLMTAHARAELKDKVDEADFKWATDTLMESLKFIAVDPITGEVDFERLQTGVSVSEMKLHEAIPELIRSSAKKMLTETEMKEFLPGVSAQEIEKCVELLSRRGDIYESPRGTWRNIT